MTTIECPNECPICYETLGNEKATMSCGHTTCTQCLVKMVIMENVGNNCPICRKDILPQKDEEDTARDTPRPSNDINEEDFILMFQLLQNDLQRLIIPRMRPLEIPPPQRSQTGVNNPTRSRSRRTEPSSRPRTVRRCSVCKQPGHNAGNGKYHPKN